MAGPNNIGVTLSLKTSDFSKGLAKAKAETKSFGYEAGLALGRAPQLAAKMLGAGIVAGATAMVFGTKRALEYGAGLKHLSDRTGVAVDSLAIMREQFKDGGLDADSLAGSIGKLQRNLVDTARTGAGPAAQALALFGDNANDLIQMDPAAYFTRVGKGLASIKNPAVAANAAMALFGKQGAALLPMFKETSFASMANVVGEQAKLLKENADLFNTVNNQLRHAEIKLMGGLVGFASGIAGPLSKLLERMDKVDLAGKGKSAGVKVGNVLENNKNSPLYGSWIGGAISRNDPMHAKPSEIKSPASSFWNRGMRGNISATDPRGGSIFSEGSYARHISQASHNALPAVAMTAHYQPTAESLQGLSPAAKAAGRARILAARSAGAARVQTNAKDAAYQRILERWKKGSGIQPLSSFMQGSQFPELHHAMGGPMIQGARGGLGESGGLGSTGGLSRGAYNASPLLKHSELMKSQDSDLAKIIAGGGSAADIAKAADSRSNSGGYNVVRRGDKDRAKNLQKEEQRKSMTLEGTNALLGQILASQKKTWEGEGGGGDAK